MVSGAKATPVPWSRSLVSSPPSGTMMCFAFTEKGTQLEECYASLDQCSYRQSKLASEPSVSSTTACFPANEPYCFVYDVQDEKKLNCASSKESCESYRAATNDGVFTPITKSECGPLNDSAAASSAQ